MDSILRFAENAMAGNQQQPQIQGHPQEGGVDWSHLGTMVTGLMGAEQQTGGQASFNHFAQQFHGYGQGGGGYGGGGQGGYGGGGPGGYGGGGPGGYGGGGPGGYGGGQGSYGGEDPYGNRPEFGGQPGYGGGGPGYGQGQGRPPINSGVIDSMLGHFQSQTGQQYNNGSSQQAEWLAQMVSQKLGIPIPASVLQKLISWKEQGHF